MHLSFQHWCSRCDKCFSDINDIYNFPYYVFCKRCVQIIYYSYYKKYNSLLKMNEFDKLDITNSIYFLPLSLKEKERIAEIDFIKKDGELFFSNNNFL